jgi:hypothetical protein
MNITALLTQHINDLSAQIFKLNHKWWHDAEGNRLDRNPAELICLMHSELSEAMEGERKDLMDDHLPHRKMCEVEMADTIIRILDFCGSRGYDIAGAIEEKLVYNQSRADHSHEARNSSNGKKF